MKNIYSDRWLELFLRPRCGSGSTEAEAAFIMRQLPQPQYRTVVDLCCGNGRHAHLLAAAGYRVTGVDSNSKVIEEARSRAIADVRYERLDMRYFAELSGRFDAVICLW